MRRLITTSSVLIMAFGCADAPTPRPERTSLLESMKVLRGGDVVQEGSGPWSIRKVLREGPAAVRRSRRGGVVADRLLDESMVTTVVERESETAGVRAEFGVEAEKSGDYGLVDLSLEPRAKTKGVSELKILNSEATPLPALRAGSSDDNACYDEFLEYLKTQGEAGAFSRCAEIDVAGRRLVRVIGNDGAPRPGASVRVVDADRDVIVWRGTTYGDGCVPFYPGTVENAPRTWLIEVEADDQVVRHHWNASSEQVDIELAGARTAAPIELDVVFLINTTGSMGDEIDRIKASLQGMTTKLRGLDREFDLRYGAVLYRDIADAYVTKSHPFTNDIAAFDTALQTIVANGGGDTPESLNQGLAVAVDGMEWRSGAAKVAFLIADAPPHMDYEGDVSYAESVKAAVARGIRIHAVAASGLDSVGTCVFRQIAQFTRGKFIFIEYGANVAKTAESHGVAGPVKSNNLDDILFEQIRDEIAHWGRDA